MGKKLLYSLILISTWEKSGEKLVFAHARARRVLSALQAPPGDDGVDLQGLEEPEDPLGLDLAVRGEELHLVAFTQHPSQQRFDQRARP